MENIKLPAYPQPIAFHPENTTPQTARGVDEDFAGFTKLELASLMIAQGRLGNPKTFLAASNEAHEDFAFRCVSIARAVLEEANK